MLRRWLCGLTPWTPHEWVLGRRRLQLFEATCFHCGDHRWGHQDYDRLLPWTIQTEAAWADVAPVRPPGERREMAF